MLVEDPSWDLWFNSTEESSLEVGSTAIFPGLHADVGRLDSVLHHMLGSSTNNQLFKEQARGVACSCPACELRQLRPLETLQAGARLDCRCHEHTQNS